MKKEKNIEDERMGVGVKEEEEEEKHKKRKQIFQKRERNEEIICGHGKKIAKKLRRGKRERER